MTHSASFFSSAESIADTPTPLSSIGEESSAACHESPTAFVGETARVHDADDTVDYFQAQGRMARERLAQ